MFGLRKFTGGLGDEDDDLTDDSEVSEADTSAVSGQVPRWANFFSSVSLAIVSGHAILDTSK